jgi:hypothetical protein
MPFYERPVCATSFGRRGAAYRQPEDKVVSLKLAASATSLVQASRSSRLATSR